MVAALDRLRRALEVCRRDLTLSYARGLAGDPVEPSRALAFLVSDEALEGLMRASESGELSPPEFAAMAAHFARARLEHGFRRVRAAQREFGAQPLEAESERLTAGAALVEWSRSRVPARRALLARTLDGAFAELATTTLAARGRADGALHGLTSRLALPRHPDAGPEKGTREPAERFLRDTDDLAREAVALAMKQEGLEPRDGVEALFALQGPRFANLFPAEGQARRVALDWEPLGLRRQLAASGRLTFTHGGPFVHAHVLAVQPPRDVRIAPSAVAFGLGLELAMADATGRAVGHSHASPALPVAIRLATVSSVARSLGALAVLRFGEPLFLRRLRGLVKRDAEQVSRSAAAFALVDARLCAAAVLARALRGPDAAAQAADLATRAVTVPLPPGLGAALVLRLSPGGPFRARREALGVAWALREQFDEDWFQNPRVEAPLRGAAARAGDFSAEAFAAEIGANAEQGIRKLAELF